MKKFLISVLLSAFMLGGVQTAEAFKAWRYREHATDCTALTDGKNADLCYEIDSDDFYKCEPDSGDCSGTEWKLMRLNDAGAESISGTWEVQDDVSFNFGTAAEWGFNYDDSVDDQFLLSTAKVGTQAITDPMFEILVDTGVAGMTAEQEVFGIAVGSQASNTPLFVVDEDGDIKIGSGTSGAIDFGVNSIDDDHAGNLQNKCIRLKPESARISGTYITTGADLDNSIGALLFDTSADEEAGWHLRIPDSYGSNPRVKLAYSMASATSGTVGPEILVGCATPGDAEDVDSMTLSAANDITGGQTVAGTAGYLQEISISLTDADSMAAGDHCWIELYRDVDDDDTATGDMEVRDVDLCYDLDE